MWGVPSARACAQSSPLWCSCGTSPAQAQQSGLTTAAARRSAAVRAGDGPAAGAPTCRRLICCSAGGQASPHRRRRRGTDQRRDRHRVAERRRGTSGGGTASTRRRRAARRVTECGLAGVATRDPPPSSISSISQAWSPPPVCEIKRVVARAAHPLVVASPAQCDAACDVVDTTDTDTAVSAGRWQPPPEEPAAPPAAPAGDERAVRRHAGPVAGARRRGQHVLITRWTGRQADHLLRHCLCSTDYRRSPGVREG